MLLPAHNESERNSTRDFRRSGVAEDCADIRRDDSTDARNKNNMTVDFILGTINVIFVRTRKVSEKDSPYHTAVNLFNGHLRTI